MSLLGDQAMSGQAPLDSTTNNLSTMSNNLQQQPSPNTQMNGFLENLLGPMPSLDFTSNNANNQMNNRHNTNRSIPHRASNNDGLHPDWQIAILRQGLTLFPDSNSFPPSPTSAREAIPYKRNARLRETPSTNPA